MILFVVLPLEPKRNVNFEACFWSGCYGNCQFAFRLWKFHSHKDGGGHRWDYSGANECLSFAGCKRRIAVQFVPFVVASLIKIIFLFYCYSILSLAILSLSQFYETNSSVIVPGPLDAEMSQTESGEEKPNCDILAGCLKVNIFQIDSYSTKPTYSHDKTYSIFRQKNAKLASIVRIFGSTDDGTFLFSLVLFTFSVTCLL